MNKLILFIAAAAVAVNIVSPVITAKAWNTSREELGEITDPAYQFPAFSNGEVLLNKKQGRLPAMGWNSWNPFGSANTEALTKAMADAIVELGLDELGYEYVVLDDGCYKSTRDDNGLLTNDTTKFPSGFKSLADYIHGKGLKFGMYNDIGTNLCAGSAVGTAGYEDLDAQTYKEWGVDFLKVDNCYYLWDNATYSSASNAQYVYAPRIRSITLSGNGFSQTLNAVSDGVLTGSGAVKSSSGNYVNYIGTKDGTNVGQTPVGDLWSELQFTVNAPAAGEYSMVVNYASGAENGTGRWLQAAVGSVDNETRYYDNLLPASSNTSTFIDSAAITIELEEGENIIRLMNHRRQENTLQSYAALIDGINKYDPNHDTVLSICEWGKTQPQNWGYKVGNSWRILNDITFRVGTSGSAAWESTNTASIASQYNKAVIMDEFAGLDKGWNDPDLLVIGMKGITTTMSKTHMTMWCMMNSPLMLGMDLRNVKKGDDIYNIIANEDLIALNQDALGIQSKRIYSSILTSNPDTTYTENNNRVDILAKPLANGDVALSFINVSQSADSNAYSVSVDDIVSFIGDKMADKDAFENAGVYTVKDLWTKEESTNTDGIFKISSLAGCDNVTIRISPAEGGGDARRRVLNNEIIKAEELLASKTESINDVKNALNTEIAAAKSVYENESAEGDEIMSAYNSLVSAEENFKKAYEEYELLGEAIAAAEKMLKNSDKYIDDEAWAEFVSALESARAAYDNPDTAKAVSDALDNLNSAKSAVHWEASAAFGPTAWYVFDDMSAQTVADISGNGNDAQLVNSGAKILEDGILSLNANNENNGYMQIPADVLSGAKEFTFAAWVKIGEQRKWARLFDFGKSSTEGYMFAAPLNDSGLFRFAMTSTNNKAEEGLTAESPSAGEWLHVAVVQSGTTVTVYYNGKPVSLANVSLTPADCIKDGTNCYIGKSQFDSDAYLKAELKDIRIYDKPLSDLQIYTIANDITEGYDIKITADDNVNFSVTNLSGEPKTVQMFADKKDETGRLEKVFASVQTIEPYSEAIARSDFDFGDEETEVKVYVWDENNRPLMDARTVVLNEKIEYEKVNWDIVRPDSGYYTVNSDTSVTINTQYGDLWGKANGAGNVNNMFFIDVPEDSRNDFTAEVTVKFKPSENYQRAAIIAYTGDGEQVSVMRRYHSSYDGNVFMTTMNTAGKAGSEKVYTADSYGEECILRLTKSGSTFKGYFSADNGETWNELETRTQANLANAENLKIGFYASNGEWDAVSAPVTFENFILNGQLTGGFLGGDEAVTNVQLTAMLLSAAIDENSYSGYMDYALENGIITDMEAENPNAPITRQSTARIAHEVLDKVYNEPDEENWTAAEALADLYECNTCVMHVAQVYLKGIMTGYGDGLFHFSDTLTRTEAEEIAMRVADPSLRAVPQIKENDEILITAEQAFEMMGNGAVLVDVRPAEDYAAGHIKGSISIPIENIVFDPSAAFAELDKNSTIIVYCRRGTNSRRAAMILGEAGYENVYNLGGIENGEYELTTE